MTAGPRHDSKVRRLLPVKLHEYLVLLVLADGERHGYGMVRDIERETAGEVRPEPGNLYRTVRRLVRNGLIEESAWRPAPESDDARRRYYRLTPLGRQVAAAEAERMRRLVLAAEARRLISRTSIR